MGGFVPLGLWGPLLFAIRAGRTAVRSGGGRRASGALCGWSGAINWVSRCRGYPDREASRVNSSIERRSRFRSLMGLAIEEQSLC